MKDYSECLINIREFLRRAENCFQANNHMGAYHHLMQAFKETEDVMEIALEKGKDQQ